MALSFFKKGKDKEPPKAAPAPAAPAAESPTQALESPNNPAQGGGIVVEEAGGDQSLLDQAALLYASQQFDDTEKMLLSTLEKDDGLAWHMLFDFYRVMDKSEAFEKLAVNFALRFETSPPMWAATKISQSATPVKVLNLPAQLDMIAAGRLRDDLAHVGKTAPLRVDFSRTSDIDEAGAKLVATVLANSRHLGQHLEVSGVVKFLELLKRKLNTQPATEAFWLMQLALLQLMGRQKEFEDLAVDYAVRFELSPPSWDTAVAAREVEAAPDQMAEEAYRLEGVLGGNQADTWNKLNQYAAQHTQVILDLSSVPRIEYASVGQFMNLLMQLLGQGKTIVLRGQNALIQQLFLSMGIGQLATLSPAPRI